jgi:competence protein ComGC
MKYQRKIKFSVFFLAVFLVSGGLFFGRPAPIQAAGASLYLTPAAGTYVIGSRFRVSVKVNTGGQTINAAQGTISFDNKLLSVVGISRSGAVFNLWTTEPTFSNSAGTINFGGGIPNPGYNGNSGHVCTITFQAKKTGAAQVRFTSGAVLANDGKGTNILASMGSANYKVSPEVKAPPATGGEKKKSTKSAEEKEYNKPTITSPTHPDQNKWFRERTVKFKWELPEGVTGVSLKFDQESDSDPGPVSDGLLAEKEYENVNPGIWYFHLKFKDRRHWGTIAHYRVMVDPIPPAPIKMEIKQEDLNDWPILFFQTEDKESGLDKYEIIIGSLETRPYEVPANKSTLKVDSLEPGEHTAMIKAIDKAGNETYAQIKFTIKPLPAPVITSYPAEVKPSDRFYLSGTAVSEGKVTIYLARGDKLLATSSVPTNQNGEWFYLYNKSLPEGRYVVWAEAINKNGLRSEPSQKVSFLVSPPVFAVIGSFVINYFTVLVSLLFMIILIIVLVVYLASLIRKKLKKETIEVETVLRRNTEALKKEIDHEFAKLTKLARRADIKEEQARAKQRLKKKLEANTKKTLKEIKDVESLLK